MEKKHVFVILTAGDCYHCQTFKDKYLDELRREITERNLARLIYLDVDSTNHVFSTDFHPDFSKYISWYPTFLLFEQNSWLNHKSSLKGSVMNGEFINDDLNLITKYAIDTKGILNWLNDELLNNRLFKKKVTSKKPTILFVNNQNDILNDNKLKSNIKFRHSIIE